MTKRRRDRKEGSPFELGSREWLALPDLGLPAVKAKVDTGARTSALHASRIERTDDGAKPRLRFAIHPVPGREDIELVCEAPLIGSREVTSSNGERELRYIIETTVEMGGRRWPIQVSLTNREQMTYRMLLGRQAIEHDMVVVPNRSFLNPRLGYQLYRGLSSHRERESLRIAVLMRPSPAHCNVVAAFAAACSARQYQVSLIDPGTFALRFGAATARIAVGSGHVETYDAVLPCLPGPPIASRELAMLRQLQLDGAFAVNTADALMLADDELRTLQLLDRANAQDLGAQDLGEQPNGLSVDLATAVVVGGRLVFAISGSDPGAQTLNPHSVSNADQLLVEAAARALGLGLCRVDFTPADRLPGRSGHIHNVVPLPQANEDSSGAWMGTKFQMSPDELALLMSRIVEFIEFSVRGRARPSGAWISTASKN